MCSRSHIFSVIIEQLWVAHVGLASDIHFLSVSLRLWLSVLFTGWFLHNFK